MTFKIEVRQQGAALLTSLLILLVLSVLAISSMRGTTLQEQMVASQRDSQIALEAAEFALYSAEQALESWREDFDITNAETYFDTLPGAYVPASKSTIHAPIGSAVFDSSTWTDANSVKVAGYQPIDTMSDGANLQPRYFIEEVTGESMVASGEDDINVKGYTHESNELQVIVYRIVARGLGRSGTSARFIESYYLLEQ